MTDSINLNQGIGRKELNKIRRRFNALQQQRLQRLNDELINAHKDFLSLLPLLLHINHPILPGYISNDVPCGFPDYNPDRKTLLIAKKYGRSFEYKKKALRTIPLHGLYLMGSVGTIAQTADSDLDFWLCHAHNLTAEEVDLLQQKATLIEEFCMAAGLEVHFFLMDAVNFKAGEKLVISSESSGSTQHHLLLEEFYRTSILIVGRPPLWWIVPSEEEGDYTNYTNMLIKKRFIDPMDWIDFGGMEDVLPEEFFGAAHWQLYKGIEAPYKAILKILLMESYAADFPKTHWLCMISKSAIFQGDDDVIDIDPYVLIYRQVESHLSVRNEHERLELARRCFYFKLKIPLSRSKYKKDDWKVNKLRQLINEWQWTDEYLTFLDSRSTWKLEQVQKERNILVHELTHSYRVLMKFARSNAATGGIDPLELNLLGRKLYAALERRPGKIELINPSISKDLIEPRLCFQFEQKKEQIRWLLYRSDPSIDQGIKPLKTTNNLVELLTWCHCNKIIHRGVQIIIRPFDCPVSIGELRHLLEIIQQTLPKHLNIKPELSELKNKAQATLSMGFMNIGFDPLAKLSRVGLQLTSDRCDPLSFSGAHINLAQRMEQLTINSWGEVEVFSFTGSEGLLESICKFLQSTRLTKKKASVSIHGFGSGRSQHISNRIEQLTKSLVNCFYKKGPGLNSQYILEIGHYLACIRHKDEAFSFILFDDKTELLDHLGENNEEFSPIVFDKMAMPDHPLPQVFKFNKPDVIQLFSWQQHGGTQLYILDENGSLFHQYVSNANEQNLLIQQQRFLNSLSERRSLISIDSTAQLLQYSPDFYRIKKSDDEAWHVEKINLPESPIVDNYIDLELVTGNGSDHLSGYTINCAQEEFDYLLLSDDIFAAVAAHILSIRENAATYPIYLTAIVPVGMDNQQTWSTINLLKFKKRLENQINIAVQQLAYRA